ncbi:hypothetical protein AB0D66_26875 [Streptomyces sp. NPDC048270]|uniref:hypothetical protein n=1 Tax=Streptomyces sp. NPDC048270 TaxID=3154615 RepID=UPI0033F34DA7
MRDGDGQEIIEGRDSAGALGRTGAAQEFGCFRIGAALVDTWTLPTAPNEAVAVMEAHRKRRLLDSTVDIRSDPGRQQ